jgi:hypothetical protein
MADVKISNLCSSLDLRSGSCRQTGAPCVFAREKNFRDCQTCAFVASVTIHRSEFHVLVDSQHRPTRGLVPVRTCRATTWHDGAGAYVNTVLTHGPDQSLLEIHQTREDEVKLVCEPAKVALLWRKGEFAAA